MARCATERCGALVRYENAIFVATIVCTIVCTKGRQIEVQKHRFVYTMVIDNTLIFNTLYGGPTQLGIYPLGQAYYYY